jgi:hypothetical protein
MRLYSFNTCLLVALLVLGGTFASARAGGPFVNGKFQGRIAYSADGNHNDPDDWIASPVALAIFAECGQKDRLVHFDYNCILPETNLEWEKIHAESVLGAVKHYGYSEKVFFDCRKNLDGALANLAKAIDESSAENPLYFIVAGPMEAPYLAIQKSRPEKRPFVYCISHSRWNDGFASRYNFRHTKRSVIEQDVNWVQIADQNRLLSLSPYGKPGPAESFASYHWMRDSADAKVRFLWERMQVSTRPDPSDAGMAYFLMTGDEQADPAKLKRLLDERTVPQQVMSRAKVRIEAENFRELAGYQIEDANDRTASHRLQVKSTGGTTGSIRTRLAQPFAAASGRYDVDVRYRNDGGGQCGFLLLVNGATAGGGWESAGKTDGWVTHTLRDVAIKSGDAIEVQAKGAPARLDYVELNSR